MKNPHLQLKEAIFEIEKIAFETDKHFKEADAKIEKIIRERERLAKKLKTASPSNQYYIHAQIAAFDRRIERGIELLRLYLEKYFIENGRIEIEVPDQAKLDAAFAKASVAHERIYLVYKHTQPQLVESFLETVFDSSPPEEIKEFYERTAQREAEELNEILASLNDDGISLQP